MAQDALLIAVVDDEESVRKALGRLISAAGFNAQTFSSGQEFLRSVQQQPPHCVVLDLRMPQMSGFDVQAALLQAGARLPVVAVTGDDSPDTRARAMRQGAIACLRKPVDDAMLMDAIHAAICAGTPAPG